jgi:hypothetical protein
MGKKSENIGIFVLNKYKCINNLDRERVSNLDNSYLRRRVGN